ncbi:hypothetical protein ACIQBJ_34045, partial [Kitasatospora sp. NPDC088391]
GHWAQSQSSVLEMQSDGNLVEYRRSDGVPVWDSNTWGNNGAYLVVQPDGNSVLCKSDNSPLWHTGTWQYGGAYLKLQDDGRLNVYKNTGTENTVDTVWTTATLRNGTGLTPNRRLQGKVNYLIMQNDGNLVLYRNSDNAVMWSSNTAGNFNASLKVQNDGNAVVYRNGGGEGIGGAVWSSNTPGNNYAFLKLQDDGNLVVYRSDGGEGIGNALWATNTFA